MKTLGIFARIAMLAAIAGAFTITAATADAPTGGWVGFDSTLRDSTFNPATGHAAEIRALGCTTRTADAGLADRAVIRENGDVVRLTFAQVDAERGRFWVVGSC